MKKKKIVFKKIDFNLFKNKPLLAKILFTLWMILIFRIAASITIPGISVSDELTKDSGSFLGILNMMGGGGLAKLSIVALGISPFITASIIMQLFQSEAFPPLYRLAKSGPKGKRKINVMTRTLTLIFAVMQAIVMITQFSRMGENGQRFITLNSSVDYGAYKFFVLPLILVAGSMFALFLGEQITNKGVGNGTSLIIFSGIAAALPNTFRLAYKYLSNTMTAGIIEEPLLRSVAITKFIIYLGAFIFFLYLLTFFYKAERHIPIQQTGAGMTTDAKQMSRLPIKINPAGVMPIIFPLMLLSIPQQIVQFFREGNTFKTEGAKWVNDNLSLTSPIGLVLMVVFIFFFSIGMALVTFNPTQIMENFKKQGTFIPGIRPGVETEDYLTKVVVRLSVFSGVYLSVITIVKYLMQIIMADMYGAPVKTVSSATFGGTSMLILVSVAVETLTQIQARDTTNKIARAKMRSFEMGDDKVKGLLW